jgi:hypothetical protein
MPRDESAASPDPRGSQPAIEIDLGKAIALLALDNRLKAELATFARGPPETELVRGVRQLGAMLQFAQSDPQVIARNIHQPVLKLYQALADWCAGGKPLEVKRPPDVKTKPKVSSAHYPQGILAIGYAALVERGRYKPARAIKWFDKALADRNMAACGKDVRGWYYQATAPTGKPAAGMMQAFRDYRPQLLHLHDAVAAEDFATKCVIGAHGLGVTRLKLQKPHKKLRKPKTS